MQHPHRVVRADAADLRAGFMGHRARACVVGHLDDQRCGRADIDVHLRAVSEIDDLRHNATNDVAFRSVGSPEFCSVMRSGRMTIAASPGIAEASTAAPSRVSRAEHTAAPPPASSTSASKMLAAPMNPATNVVAGAE